MSLSVSVPGLMPAAWDDPTVAQDMRRYSQAEVQITGTIAGEITPQRSLDGTNYVACSAFDANYDTIATITVAGIYTVPGGGWLKLSGGGTDYDATVRASAI